MEVAARSSQNLATQYSAVASDGKNATQAREAAMLLAVAEGHANHEEDEDSLIAAQDALKLFRASNDHGGAADALRIIIQCYIGQGRMDEATSLAQDELATFKREKKKCEEAKLLLSLAEVCAKQAKLSTDALEHAKLALALFRELRNEHMEAKVWLVTARILLTQKSKTEGEDPLKGAEQAANDALAIFQRITTEQGKQGEAAALLVAAEVKAAAGDIDDAIDMGEDALDLLQDLKQPKLEAFMLNSIATMCLANGRPYKALHLAENALEVIREVGGSKRREVAALSSVVQALIAKGMTGKAVRIARLGLNRFQDTGETRAEADTHRVLYSAYSANGDTEQALLTMDKALEASQDAGDKTMEVQLLCEASEMSFKAGNLERAIETASKALEVSKESKDWDAANRALQCLVNGYVGQDDVKAAVDVARDFRDMLDASGNSKAEAAACLVLSQAHCAAGSFDLAASAAKAASEIAYKEDDEFLEASSLDQLTLVYMDSGKFEKAAHAAENARRLWKDLEEIPRECNSLDQIAKAFVQQAYKKQAANKSASAVGAIFEKASKAANDVIELAQDLPATENGDAFMGNAKCTLSQVHAAQGESEDAFSTAKAASDLFWKAADDRGGAYASVLMAQAEVQQEKWQAALKNANAAMKAFKKFNNESGKAFVQTVLDKIEKSMPKPVPVAPAGWGGGPAWNRPQGPQGMQVQQFQDGGGGGFAAPQVAGMLGLLAVDMSIISDDLLAAKIKEVALAIIGEDAEDVEADTPLMEAGLTSSTAVLMRDELLGVIPGVKISPTAMFDYPSVSAMTEMLMEQLKP